MDISYIINELAEDREQYFNAVAPPIIQTSNFAFNKVDALRQAFADEYSTYLYSRGKNPTVDMLCKKLAAVLANVKSGDHIVSVRNPYTWAKKMFNEILPRFNVTTTYVDGTSIENFERAVLPNTAVIYLETPNSWDYSIQDLKAVAELAKAENIITICDNSYCTPLYQRPIELGIDLSLQSATKYIGGHSDVVAGVLSGGKQMIERIFNSEYMNIGSGISPFNAWLLIRGLRTLPMRLEHITKTTWKVMEFLKQHPKVEEVLFPFDAAFPQYELAKQQMQGACGLLSFYINANSLDEVENFCESLQHIMMAVSWGGHESLIIPKCAGIKREKFKAENKDHRMMRLYVGLEEADYLIKDLEGALGKL
jgi:cystathionine beta-lyase/cystathionine gamma-synthase